MGGTPQYQRERLQKQRETQHPNLIPCLECGLSFVRVGSHAVQVHGYKTAWEYRQAHGLNKNETVLPEYQAHMREIAKNEENCHIYGKKLDSKKETPKPKTIGITERKNTNEKTINSNHYRTSTREPFSLRTRRTYNNKS